jgi:Flp pilus assembly protein TadG
MKRIAACLADRGGNIAIITALAMPVLIGTAGLGVEVGYWYYLTRGMQSAADSAAVAAATNGSSNYATEARAVAAQYGFQDGVNNAMVTASNTATCPSGEGSCYSVTITSLVPLFLSQVVGYQGTTKIKGTPYTALSSTATAKVSGTSNACMLALDPADSGSMTMQGGNLTLDSCDLAVNSSSVTALWKQGGNLTAHAIDVVGNYYSQGGKMTPAPTTGHRAVTDPYAGLYSSNDVAAMASDGPTCAGTSVTSSNPPSPGVYCGGLSFTGAGSGIKFSAGVYIIQGGSLSFHGGKISGTGVTFVLTKYNGSYATADWQGVSGSLTAPTSGPWSGMLVYADPTSSAGALSSSVTGGKLDMTGALYFPTQGLTFTGGSKSSTCTQVLGYTIALTGGGYVGSSCSGTGVQTIPSDGRGQLVD